MDTIKWLLQKAYENDYDISISKKGKAVSLKISKKTLGKKIAQELEIDEITLHRAEASTVQNLVSSVFNKISEEEKFQK